MSVVDNNTYDHVYDRYTNNNRPNMSQLHTVQYMLHDKVAD